MASHIIELLDSLCTGLHLVKTSYRSACGAKKNISAACFCCRLVFFSSVILTVANILSPLN